MSAAYQITGNALARAFEGIAKSISKPTKKVRDTSVQSSVMKDAHRMYAAERKRRTKHYPSGVVAVPAYDAQEFAYYLGKAWNTAKFAKSKREWESGNGPRIEVDAAYMASCRTDGLLENAGRAL